MQTTNWAGNYAYRATQMHEPETIDELRQIVAGTPKIHAIASRHSFNGIGDSAELVSLDKIDQGIEIDADARTVTVGAAVKYGHLAQALEKAGFALHNMASLPHISVGGAIATATHGSGDHNSNLATAVVGLELVTSDSDIMLVSRGDAEFPGMVVHLGALGVVTRLTLRIEPTYMVRQATYEHLDWDIALERFDEIMASATSVSLFTDYGDTVNQVWLKQRVTDAGDTPMPADFYGAAAITERRHPVADVQADGCTEQMGIPGPWLDRIPHFRMEFTPSHGAEIQSEYMVPRRHAVAAIHAIRDLAPEISRHLMIAEIRTVAADDLWMSTAYEQDSVCLHFTWKLDADGVTSVLPEIETALAPFSPRPHWGKVFLVPAIELEPRYERIADFRGLADRLDPRGAFRNDFLNQHLFG